MKKTAQTQVPVLDLIAERWSPRAFQDRPVEREKIVALLEAARWAPSSRNLQPWRFILTTEADPAGHARMVSCLGESNQRWARRAPVLLLAVAEVETEGRTNRTASYDVGLAVGNLTLQAMYEDLMVHQMGGFDRDMARELYHIPAAYDPICVLAIGYRDRPDSLPVDLRDRELAPRSRKSLDELVFKDTWGQSAPLVSGDSQKAGV